MAAQDAIRRLLEGQAGRRLLSLALGAPAWAVLGVALSLSPDGRGFGTHQQLGLGTCTILNLTGWPCPMCGMTTSFAHMAHLEPLQALAAQPMGVVLFLITLSWSLLALTELALPAGRWGRLNALVTRFEVHIALSLLGGLALGWGYKVLVWAPPS